MGNLLINQKIKKNQKKSKKKHYSILTMSNHSFFSTQPVCPTSAAEASNADEAANCVTFQDTLENQDMSGGSPQGEMVSNTEIRNPPTQTQSQDDDLHHQNNGKANMPTTSRSRQSVSRRELDNLRSVNQPGRSELAPLRSSRSRSPSFQKAKTIYEEAVKATQRESAEFEA